MPTRPNKIAKPRVPVALTDLENQFPEHLGFLKRSNKDFDEGHLSEYRRLATTLRVLLYSTDRSPSLLRQLGLEQQHFISFASPLNPRNLLSEFSLVITRVGDHGAKYIPLLDQSPFPSRQLLLTDWLYEPILRDVRRKEFSRLDFIKFVANQDGGAHVDPEIDEDYAQIKFGESVGLVFCKEGKEENILDIEKCYIRHISFEASLSLELIWQHYLGNKFCSCGSGRKFRYCCGKNTPNP